MGLKMERLFYLFVFLPAWFWGIFVDHPAQGVFYCDGMYSKGIHFFEAYSTLFYDDLVKSSFLDQVKTKISNPKKLESHSYGGTLHFCMSRFDLMGTVGSSRLFIDKEIDSDDALCWGGGLSILLWHRGNTYIKADGKYFHANYNIPYLLNEEKPVYPVHHFSYIYDEYQAALAWGHYFAPFLPYLAVYYNYATLTPSPLSFLITVEDFLVTLDTLQTQVIRKNLGIACGCALLANNFFTLSIEARLLAQNSYTLSLGFRY